MEIKVCVGSACHLKGSYLVIEKIQEYIKKNNLDNKIELKASFCLGKCTSNVSVLINNELLSHLETINNVIEIMQEKLEKASSLVLETLKNGNKILLCG
jgi:NADH:ubiquinone oxidoreductase subunit E